MKKYIVSVTESTHKTYEIMAESEELAKLNYEYSGLLVRDKLLDLSEEVDEVVE